MLKISRQRFRIRPWPTKNGFGRSEAFCDSLHTHCRMIWFEKSAAALNESRPSS
jgi:hypothetical protein